VKVCSSTVAFPDREATERKIYTAWNWGERDMRLRALRVQNFGCIDADGYEFEIDKIVALIGANNVGKSAILDAYEAFASVGGSLPLERFRNKEPQNTISISAVFIDLTDEDLDTLGQKWKHVSERYGECIRVKWEWSAPGEKAKKYSWDPNEGDWIAGGMGGWDTLIASRTPAPLRVRPTDDAETTESQIKEILTSAVKTALKADGGRAEGVVAALRKLTEELAQEVQGQLTDATNRIAKRLGAVFPGYTVEFAPEVGKFEPEKAIGAGSYISVKGPGEGFIPLAQQGAGLRRTFLWSALGTLADIGRAKLGKKEIAKERQRILLIEEPESFLHPPMIRAAREALYALSEVPEWQVLATTHSPVFIDVSKPHTTIVRVAREGKQRTRLFSTDRAGFSEEERENLRMIRSCHPTVAEFFFADHVVLVEGETEHAVLSVLIPRSGNPLAQRTAVVNCCGKANLPLFQRILNQFGTSYTVLHDSDAPQVKRGDGWQRNAMWTLNERILDALAERDAAHPPSRAVVHVPHFEQYYFGYSLAKDKPYQALQTLQGLGFEHEERFRPLRELVDQLIQGTHPGTYFGMDQLTKMVAEWRERASPEPPEAWAI
jgi:putative ATP-dependent endonuclease of OLD family